MKDLDYEILINRENLLPSDYVPKELAILDENENNFHQFRNPNLKPMVRKDIVPDLNDMLNDARNNGFSIIVDSGYRSYEYQKYILERNIAHNGIEYAMKFVAPPGASEHQSGLCFDIAYLYDGVYSDKIRIDDEEVKWLLENSYKYGFILRYPLGKEYITGYNSEPWHFRYVGKPLARILYENNETLEEYYKRINSISDFNLRK